MPEPLIYEYGVEMDRLLKGLVAGEAAAESFESRMLSLASAMRALETTGIKGTVVASEKAAKAIEKQGEAAAKAATKQAAAEEKRAAATKKAQEAEEKKAAAIAKMADKAEMAASALNLQGRSQELLIKIGGQYAEILRETGDANSELMKAWRAGLSPAENSARKLVELTAKTDDYAIQSKAGAVAVGELALRMEDQIRRQDTNVGSQNKLSRSLSELVDELKAAQKGTLAVAVAQAQQAESAADVALQIKQLAFDTSDAEKETDAYKNTVKALQARLEGLSLDEQRAKIATEKSAEAYGKSKQRLDALETAMEAFGIPGAGMVTAAKRVADSMETVNEKGTATQVSLLKAGIAIGAVGAAGAAAVAGVAAIGGAIVGVTAKAADWNEELSKVGLGIEQAPLERYAASIDAIGLSAKAVGVQAANVFGPSIESAATRVTAFGLSAVDAFNNLGSGQAVMERIARFASTVLVEALFAPVTALQKLSGVAGPLLEPFADAINNIKADQADAVTAALKMMAADGVAPLIAVTDDYMAQADKLIAKQTAINAANRDAAKEAKKAAEAMAKAEAKAAEDLRKELDKLIEGGMTPLEVATLKAEEAQRTLASGMIAGAVSAADAQRAMQGVNAELVAALNTAAGIPEGGLVGMALKDAPAAAEKAAKAMEETAARGKASWAGSFASIGDSAGKLSELLIKQSKKQGDAAEKAAIIAFRVQQAAGIAGVAVSTGQAIMMALGTLPPPASYVAAGAAALAGVTQAAVILSTPPPSSAGPSGGFSPSVPTAPDFAASVQSSGTQTAQAAATPQTANAIDITAPTNTNVARAEPSPVVVTDAEFPAAATPRLVRVAPGDEFSAKRAGALGQTAKPDMAAIAAMDRQTREMQGLRKDFQMLTQALLYRAHFDQAEAPAGTV